MLALTRSRLVDDWLTAFSGEGCLVQKDAGKGREAGNAAKGSPLDRRAASYRVARGSGPIFALAGSANCSVWSALNRNPCCGCGEAGPALMPASGVGDPTWS